MIDLVGMPYAKIAAAAALVVAGFLAGMGAHKMLTDPKIERMQREWAQNVTAAVEAKEKAEAEYREIESKRREVRDDAEKGMQDDKRENIRRAYELATSKPVAPAPVDAGLRGKLETARLAAQAASESASAADRRVRQYETLLADGDGKVAALEGSLGECRDLAAESAKAHDDRASEVTALLKAWPK